MHATAVTPTDTARFGLDPQSLAYEGSEILPPTPELIAGGIRIISTADHEGQRFTVFALNRRGTQFIPASGICEITSRSAADAAANQLAQARRLTTAGA